MCYNKGRKRGQEKMSDKIKVKGRKVIVKINREGHEYKGVARCHENDDFDGVIGAELALARAELKYKQEKCEVLEVILAPIQSKIDELEKEIMAYENLARKFVIMAEKNVADLENLKVYETQMSSLND